MPADTSNIFQRALALHQRGEAPGAQALYKEVLGHDPRHFDSLHLLGLTYVQQGQFDLGVRYISQAIEVKSDFPEAHYNLGNALLSMGRAEEALVGLDQAIRLDPKDPLYHFERGNALKEMGRGADALQSFEAAVRIAPRYAEAYNNIGILLKDEGKFEAALAQYDRAISLRPGYAEAHSNRGNALKELERFEEALASYDRAIALRPDYAEAYSNRGNALAKLGLPEAALESHEKAIRLKPGYAEGYNNRGNALKELGRLDDALASYDDAIRLRSDYAEAYSNRGSALEELGRLGEAMESHDTAIRLKPDFAEAHCSRGNTLVDLERLAEAAASYETAMRLKPGLALARYNKSLLELRAHHFAEGFELYGSRFAAEKPGARGPATTIPQWNGEAVEGEILLWAEQGLGDEVFFASMLSLLDTGTQKVALSADTRLHAALARAFPAIRLLGREETAQGISGTYAAQAAIGDLGRLLRIDAAKVAARRYPYLTADGERLKQVRAANPMPTGKLVCGISWKSGNKKVGPHRSIALADLAPLLQLPDVSFVNLQYGKVEEEIAEVGARIGNPIHIARDVDVFGDIEGLLALIEYCDVVFTIDNVTAHLAGALGKQAVVLVPCGNGRHWYWGGESQSLWYPSLRLLYQQAAGSWSGTIAAAASHVAACALAK